MHFSRDEMEKFIAHSSGKHPHLHHKRGSMGSGHAAEEAGYFEAVVKLLGQAQEILVLGPGSEKLELIKYLHKHHHTLVDRIKGVESADHPTDAQVVAHARRYFAASDRMLEQGGRTR